MNRFIELERALQEVLEEHGCDCRGCQYAWNVLHRIPDSGHGIPHLPHIRRIPEMHHG